MFTRRTAVATATILALALVFTSSADAAKPPKPPDEPPAPLTNPALAYTGTERVRAGYVSRVYAITADGSEKQPLTSMTSWKPAWKPDGTQVAFLSHYKIPDTRFSYCNVLGAVNADGTGERILLDTCTHPVITQIDKGSSDRIDWSADNEIAFSDGWYLWTLDPDTGATENVFPTQAAWDIWEGSTHLVLENAYCPTWSPDSRLAFIGVIHGYGGATYYTLDIFIYDPATGTTTNLTYTPGESICEEYIDWSPDGQYITYNYPGQGIYKISPSGPTPGELVLTAGQDAHLSPGSQYMAFVDKVVIRNKTYRNLFRADADGANVVNLTDDDTSEDLPDWNPAWENDL